MDPIDVRHGVDLALEPLEQHWRNLFNGYDLDNDGQIDVNEFIARLRNDANEDIHPNVFQRLQSLAQRGDRCVITYPEFINLLTERSPRNAFQRIFLLYIKHVVPPRSRKIGMHNRALAIDTTNSRNYEDEYSCSPPALCMVIVSVIEVFVFLMALFKVLPVQRSCPFTYFPDRRKEFWRFLTYMFIHDGPVIDGNQSRATNRRVNYNKTPIYIVTGVYIYIAKTEHLLINVVVQILLGIPLEMVHGWWRVLLVYVAGVVAGSLGTSICDNIELVGASGGVYALITAHIATIILNWSEMKFALYQLLVFFLLAIFDLKRAIESRYQYTSSQISFTAHFAGGLAGLLVGFYILRNIQVHSWERKLSRIAVIAYVVLMIAIVIFNIAFTGYYQK